MRIQAAKAEAMCRFGLWLNLHEMEPPTELYWAKAYEQATINNEWRGTAFFVFENEDWTVFEDMTGYLGSKSAQDWLQFACGDAVVFAGYNVSVPYAEIIVIHDSQIVRQFRDDKQEPSQNINEGRLSFEESNPIDGWVEAASYVDGDDLAVSADNGTLWMFHGAA